MRGLGANSIYQSQFSQQAIVANLAGTLTDLTGTLSAGVLATDYTQASMQSVGLPGALVKITGENFDWNTAAWRAWQANRQLPPDFDPRRG